MKTNVILAHKNKSKRKNKHIAWGNVFFLVVIVTSPVWVPFVLGLTIWLGSCLAY